MILQTPQGSPMNLPQHVTGEPARIQQYEVTIVNGDGTIDARQANGRTNKHQVKVPDWYPPTAGDQVLILDLDGAKQAPQVIAPVTCQQGIGHGGSGAGGYQDLVADWGADKTGVIDSTANFLLAAAAGSTFIPDGTYKIDGLVAWPVAPDLIGAGAGRVTLKLGVNGQLKIGDRSTDSPFIGGQVSGFKIDGQGVQNVAGGALYVGFCLKKKFADIYITDPAGDGLTIETAQNCTWDTIQITNTGRSCVVFDYGAGGHIFYNPELANPARHAVEYRQTGESVGGYPTFLGPSNNLFYGGICEYGTVTSPYALFYHGAGTNNQNYGLSVSPTGRTVAGPPAILMEAAANAISTTCTVTSGSSTFTVANPAGIEGLMAARVPGFPAGSVVADVVGSTVTMFGPATSSHAAGTPCSFGAESSQLAFDGLVTPGSDGFTYGIEMKGNCSIDLSGRSTFTNHVAAFKTYSNDRISINGPVSYFGTPTSWVAHPSDDSGAAGSFDLCVRSFVGAGVSIRTGPGSSARGLSISRPDQAQPHTEAYTGTFLFSDGSFAPVTTGVGFALDADDGLHYAHLYTQARTAMLKVTGAPGATVDARYFGRYQFAGPPVGGGWRVGDWVHDVNGTVWACTVAGTPGTWSAGAVPSYAALTYPANAAAAILAAGHFAAGSSRDTEHKVLLRGAIGFSATFAAGATLATVTAAHRPASLVHSYAGLKYDSGGTMSLAPLLVDSSGVITSKVAFAAGDDVFIDGWSYHTA